MKWFVARDPPFEYGLDGSNKQGTRVPRTLGVGKRDHCATMVARRRGAERCWLTSRRQISLYHAVRKYRVRSSLGVNTQTHAIFTNITTQESLSRRCFRLFGEGGEGGRRPLPCSPSPNLKRDRTFGRLSSEPVAHIYQASIKT